MTLGRSSGGTADLLGDGKRLVVEAQPVSGDQDNGRRSRLHPARLPVISRKPGVLYNVDRYGQRQRLYRVRHNNHCASTHPCGMKYVYEDDPEFQRFKHLIDEGPEQVGICENWQTCGVAAGKCLAKEPICPLEIGLEVTCTWRSRA